MVFIIKPGPLYESIIPETDASRWGPVPLSRLPDGTVNACNILSHGLAEVCSIAQLFKYREQAESSLLRKKNKNTTFFS
jgi:hypothetical protein